VLSLEAPVHTLSGDATRLQQAFWNLLKNASKFTPAGGEIRIATRADDGWFVATFSDDGVGIDAEVLSHVFDAFSQGGAWVSREFGGLGLGLAIAKATVDAHGGTLAAASAGRGQGATFTLSLPLSDA
jgi:two-component system CheB/CheR fusion protein